MTTKQMISQLGKKFKEFEGDDEIIKGDILKGYLDPTNVCMLIPKTERLNLIFKSTFEVEPKDIPRLEGELKTSKFSIEYLSFLLELLKQSKDEGVTLTIGDNFPLTAETKEFKFILAPRVNN